MQESLPNIQHIIRELEIHTKRLLSGTLFGDNRSATKGAGVEFDSIREYQPGDDVRFIDWNATARNNTFLYKQCIEERRRKIVLAIDVSASTQFSSNGISKYHLMAQIASILALVATYGKDQVSCLLFSDEVEVFVPLGNSQFHTRWIMHQLFSHRPKKVKTRIESALEYLAKLRYRDAITFLISDFIDESLDSRYLSVVTQMYDLIAIRCLDSFEQQLPNIGFLKVQDMESGTIIELDTRKNNRNANQFLTNRVKEQNGFLKKKGIDLLTIRKENLIGDVVRFFRKRMSY